MDNTGDDGVEPGGCAPVALFVYNRPEHTRRTLESLSANPLASHTKLFIYSDGPRSAEDVSRVESVRSIVKERAWCGRVEVIESPENRGLAASITEGVTAVLAQHERVIVLEDDLDLSPGFLRYMNDALETYADEPQVMSISGWVPPFTVNLPETFFLRTTTSWGWATWRRAWRHYQPNAEALKEQLLKSHQVRAFNLDGGYDYFTQLRLNAEGKLKTWAVLWYASIFLNGGLSLHPRHSLVKNIGHDRSGTHCRADVRFGHEQVAEYVTVKRISIESHTTARAALRRHLRGPVSQRLSQWWRTATKRVRRELSLRAC